MKKTGILAALSAALILSGCNKTETPPTDAEVRAKTGMPVMATISYWEVADYAKLPSGGIGLINPNDGIAGATQAQIDAYKPVVADAVKRNVRLLAYVQTGYGERDPNKDNTGGTKGQSMEQIKGQVDKYIKEYGAANLYGIFFDETDEPCDKAKTDYAEWSSYVRSKGLKVAAFNPGWTGLDFCFVNATPRGDIITVYESNLDIYLNGEKQPDGSIYKLDDDLKEANKLAHANGALTWHLIHTAVGDADLKKALDALKKHQPDYAYVTDLRDWTTGDNTWGAPPSYWAKELKCLQEGICP